MTKQDVRSMLPNIGDTRKGGKVVEVNHAHCWYRIEKKIAGKIFYECFRVTDGAYTIARTEPKAKPHAVSNMNHKRIHVRCINTGKIFHRCVDAAREYGLTKDQVTRAARLGKKVGDIYRFEYVEATV